MNRRRLLLGAGALAIAPALAFMKGARAQNAIKPQGQPFFTGTRRPLGHETLVLTDQAVHGLQQVAAALAAGTAIGFVLIRVRCPANPTAGGVAWRDDGVAPTVVAGVVTNGMPCEAGTEEDYYGDPGKLQFLQLTADTTYVHVEYYS